MWGINWMVHSSPVLAMPQSLKIQLLSINKKKKKKNHKQTHNEWMNEWMNEYL